MKRTQPHSGQPKVGRPKFGRLRARQTRSRRGALLLVVLSILVLFALIGITYVVTASSYKKGAEAYKRRDPNHDDPQKEIDAVAMQVLRGPRAGTLSALKDHDLLGDMYGVESVRGEISIAPIKSNGLMVLKFNYDPTDPQEFVPVSGYYGGCVMTFLSGDAKGHSVRILRYEINGPNTQAVFTVDRISHSKNPNATPANGDDVLVNGRPFSGTGFGLEVAGGTRYSEGATLDHEEGTRASALLPNHSMYDSSGVSAGGADEPYDAPDYQNMAMSAYTRPIPANSSEVLPSFHRQDLIAYWAQKNGGTVPPALKRKIMLRPSEDVHTGFDGSNPDFIFYDPSDPIDPDNSYTWDVDNDLDNVADSIWVDPGMPVKTDREGRRYKALAAILVKDMDGKLNVNAHGSYAAFKGLDTTDPTNLLATRIDTTVSQILDPALPPPHQISKLARTNAGAVANKIGVGYGPADVNLRGLFSIGAPGDVEFLKILRARYTDNRSTAPNAPDVPGIYNNNDPLSRLMTYGVPGLYPAGGYGRHYGSHPQSSGFYNTVSDHLGRPMTYGSVDISNDFLPVNDYKFSSTTDDPYELNLVGRDASDSPFAAEELERMLRYNDIDAASFPSRLLLNAKNTFDDPEKRAQFTTHSSQVTSLPVPPIPRDIRDTQIAAPGGVDLDKNQIDKAVEDHNVAPTIIDLARERIRRANTSVSEVNANKILKTIMPWEILQGEPMDLNRMFDNPHAVAANAYDYKGAHVFPMANYGSLSPQYLNDFDNPAMPFFYGIANNLPLALDTGSDPRIESTFAKQLYARHLFCLLMLLRDEGFRIPPFDSTDTINAAGLEEITVRRLAQWAINVVDYRDNDGIMTPFEYDMNPFNGWGVDGDPTGNENTGGYVERRLVWGNETPDLLLTETLAFHDRKVKDTDFDNSADPKFVDDPGMNPDNDLDQYRVPQGSLFLELYTARNFEANNTQAPSELYNGAGMLDLGRLTSHNWSGSGNYPVWRVVITQHQSSAADKLKKQAIDRTNLIHFQPHDTELTDADPAKFNPLNTAAASDPLLKIDRMIYFTNSALPNNADANRDLSKFNELSFKYREGARFLNPNGFTVIGPRPRTYLGTKKSTGADPDVINAATGSQYFDISGGAFDFVSPDVYPNNTKVKAKQGVVCTMDAPAGWAVDPDEATVPTSGVDVGLNISEPLPNSGTLSADFYNGAAYYDEPDYNNGYYSDANPMNNTVPATVMVPDDPFDTRGSRPLASLGGETKSHPDYKSVLLQRLADPTRGYHATSNPYITVDWKPVDLHVFNGEDNHDQSTVATFDLFDDDEDNSRDPNDADALDFVTQQAGLDGGTTPDKHLFGAFKNGLLDDNANRTTNLQLTDESDYGTDPTPRNTGTYNGDYFSRPLKHTFGYMNRGYGDVSAAPNELYSSLDVGTVVPEFYGTPKDGPFGWVAHPNRPLVSKYELLNVPASAPQRLLYENSMFNDVSPVVQYGADGAAPVDNYTGRFGGLFNFFHSRKLDGASDDNDRRAHYYRILDYVTVPSKFVGSQKHYRSDRFADTTNPLSGPDDVRERFRYPFSKRSEFRDPGVINLNTMVSNQVFEAIYSPSYWTTNASHVTYGDMKKSILGQDLTDTYNSATRSYPSWFANPFRPSGVAEMTPEPTSAVSGINSTSLRSGKLLNGTGLGAGDDEPLFRFDTSANVASNHYRDTQKNPMYRYQGIQRLGNLTGYQSNVYAVWVTIGYFEVTPTTVNAAIPDGWQLGAELGSDTGDINRHRGFYIMDRSIPVGYEPGEDHNTDDAILVRRFIE
ncbi:MAG: hypothetical protein ACKVH8_21570 [Pirellulales bacterium]